MSSEQRQYQVFCAGLAEGEELGIEPSPWFVGDTARIPLEHWEALQKLADERHFVESELWEDMSFLDEVYGESSELKMFEGGLRQLQKSLRQDMTLMLQRTSHCPEPLPGWEHARMLEAVLRVLELAGEEVESYLD